MDEQQKPLKVTQTDVAKAMLEWGRNHGKTSEQMKHLTDAEAAECYKLARAYALLRLMGDTGREASEGIQRFPQPRYGAG